MVHEKSNVILIKYNKVLLELTRMKLDDNGEPPGMYVPFDSNKHRKYIREAYKNMDCIEYTSILFNGKRFWYQKRG